MFRTVFTFELAYWFKRPLTLLFFALFFLMAFFSTASDAFLGIGGGQIHRNAPFVLATADGNPDGDRAGDHDGGRRNGGAARRAARHRRTAVHDASLEVRLSARPIRGVVRRDGRDLPRRFRSDLFVGTLMPWVPADKLGPDQRVGAFQPFFADRGSEPLVRRARCCSRSARSRDSCSRCTSPASCCWSHGRSRSRSSGISTSSRSRRSSIRSR